ncbi:ABC transporter permease [Tenggerimyces flavus]|uniref:ABC transporter permease n=1 Tax=Tenggerimyces flavus TaxID=1708749 RepID=A0ABV7YH03_9ACTN|nr:ABC transporter permease [Tenggerimyces flavus]MBM7784526.1 ABC-2 type transport system permease protein [Tenggerimyces flavus]
MSAADVATAEPVRVRTRPPSPRFFVSELWLIFGRRRNWAGMAVLAAVPIIIAVAMRLSNDEGGGTFFGSITDNGMFVALAALSVELPLFLPLAVGAISGDAIAGEANLGTLRNLLTVPVHRTRLILTKYAAIVVFALAAVLLVLVVGTLIGLALFGGGPVTLLSGTQVSLWEGLFRVLLVALYMAVCLSALGAIGLFISTLTEQPIGATIAAMILTIVSQILGQIPQLDWLHPYLFTRYWLAFGDLLTDPIATSSVWPGLQLSAAYIAIFVAASWARFASRDVSS